MAIVWRRLSRVALVKFETPVYLDLIFLSSIISKYQVSLQMAAPIISWYFYVSELLKGRKESDFSIHVHEFSKSDDLGVLEYT